MSQPSFDGANESANAREIRENYDYRNFVEDKDDLWEFLAARV